MSTPILATKLYLPPPRPDVVSRPRLIERLNEGLHRTLTLISASAGFGKTTLPANGLRAADVPAAWLSLDKGDSDPARFLSYLIAALRTIAADSGRESWARFNRHSRRRLSAPHAPAQRDCRDPGPFRPCSRRLSSSRRQAGRPGARLSARIYAALDASGHRHPEDPHLPLPGYAPAAN